MKKLVLVSLLLASSSFAQTRVMFFSDSLGLTGWPHQWPQIVKAQRPDITICEVAVSGRPTTDGITQVQPAMEWCGGVTDVVVMLGVNDPKVLGETDPRETARRLRQIAGKIRAKGARELILTPVPATWDRNTAIDHQEFTREIRRWLYQMNGGGPAYNVIDVRDAFTEVFWDSCATDGIHPDGQECRQAIADYVSARLP